MRVLKRARKEGPICQRAEVLSERREALALWAQIVTGQRGEVVPFRIAAVE
jgi:hypothetical protein